MYNRLARPLLIFLAAWCLALPVQAGFEKGQAAYARGDYAAALKAWRPLAQRGNALAQYNLGVMYEQGQGVPQDFKEALRWFLLAAEQGNVNAQNNLGVMYEKGLGVPQDFREAMRWYRLAAEQGNAMAQFNLGLMYAYGKWEGRYYNYREALNYYRLAAEQGHAGAINNLGVMYENGRIVDQDRVLAYALYNASAVLAPSPENIIARENRDTIARTLRIPGQIETAQALSHELVKPGNFGKALDAYLKSTRRGP